MVAAAWPRAGDTLLMPSGPEGDHLFVVLCDPQPFPGYGPNHCVVLVGLSSVREGVPHDDACVLPGGCHPFVRHPSFMNYRHARVERVEHLYNGVAGGVFVRKDPFSAEWLERMRRGVLASRFVRRELRDFRCW